MRTLLNKSDHGFAAVETALLLPMLAMILMLLVEGVSALKAYSDIAEASRSAARQMIIADDTTSASALVQALAKDLETTALHTTVALDGASVTVEVSYDYQPYFSQAMFDAFTDNGITLVAQTTMPMP